MKKSNIFFGVTAFALAIAGAFASKAGTKVKSVTGYSKNGTACAAAHTGLSCTLTQETNFCKAPTNNVQRTLYTRATTIVGGNPVYSCSNHLWTIAE